LAPPVLAPPLLVGIKRPEPASAAKAAASVGLFRSPRACDQLLRLQ